MSRHPAAPLRQTLHVKNSLDEIGRLSEAIEEFFGAHTSPGAVSAVNLAVEELVTNVMSYAFPDGGEHDIRVDLSLDADGLTAAVGDDGPAYNPLEREAPDTDATLDDRPVGGLGIHLVRQLMDDVAYARRDGRNIITVRKRDEAE